MNDVGVRLGSNLALRPDLEPLAACCFLAFDLVRRGLRLDLAGGLEPPTACLQRGPGQDGERAGPQPDACTVRMAVSDRPGSLGSGWGQTLRLRPGGSAPTYAGPLPESSP